MKIELKQRIPKQAPDYTDLLVNGIKIGEYICGKDKKYLNPEKWAKQMIKNRNVVIDRNIARLKKELENWETEKEIINS